MVCLLLVGSAHIYAQKKGTKPAPAPTLQNAKDSISYALGINFGNGLQGGGFSDLNLDALKLAIQHVLAGNPTLLPAEEAMALVQSTYEKNQEKMTTVNKEAGEKFLAENKKKEGVVTTASGLQYKVVRMGTGPIPTAADEVEVHYTGRLIDGKVFDSSVERGESITFPVTGVIQGWVEALQLMPKGSAWTLYIPYQLAYGERGAGGTIPPYSTLIFDVELIDIKSKDGGTPFPPR